jgi:hypothetical protein
MRAQNVYTQFFSLISLLLGCLFYVPSPFCLFTFVSIQPIDNFFSLSFWFWLTAVCFFMFFLNSQAWVRHTHIDGEQWVHLTWGHEERILIPFFLFCCAFSYPHSFLSFFCERSSLYANFLTFCLEITFSISLFLAMLSLTIAISIICHSQEKKSKKVFFLSDFLSHYCRHETLRNENVFTARRENIECERARKIERKLWKLCGCASKAFQ